MSFWEDRFVNRPHAGGCRRGPVHGRAGLGLPASAVSRRAVLGVRRGLRDRGVLACRGDRAPVELVEVVPVEDESFDAAEPVESADDADLFSVDEPTRGRELEAEPSSMSARGFFRRRKPSSRSPRPKSRAAGAGGGGRDEVFKHESWSVVAEPDAEFSYEADEPAEERSRGEEARPLQTPQERRGRERRRDGARGHHGSRVGREQRRRGTSRSRTRSGRSRRSPHRPRSSRQPAEEPKKRGLFRAASREPVAEDADAEPLEDESFEHVTSGAPRSPSRRRAGRRAGAEPSREADTYVYGEDESQADDASAEPAEDDVRREPAHEVVADGSEDDAAEDSSASRASPSLEAEVDASEDTEVDASEDVESSSPRTTRRCRRARGQRPDEVEDEPQAESTATSGRAWTTRRGLRDRFGRRRRRRRRRCRARSENGGGSRGKKVVGLKIGASQIAAAVVSGNGETRALVDVARRSLEEGIVVGGEVRDETRSPVPSRRSSTRAAADEERPHRPLEQPHRCPHPRHRRRRGRGAIRQRRPLQGARGAPGRAHESVLDYRVLEERSPRTARSRAACCSSSRRATRSSRTSRRAARPGSGSPASTSRPSAFSARSFPPFGTRSRTEDTATVVVSIGHESSTLLVAGGGTCEFTRVFDWGGGAAPERDRGRARGAAHAEAATILRHLSLDGPGPPSRLARRGHASRAPDAVRTRLTPVRPGARELAPVLPDPARVSRHRRDPDHRRYLPSRGSRRRAPPDDRRQRQRRRSARCGSTCGATSRPRSTRRSARSPCRSGLRSRTSRCAASTCCRRKHARRRSRRGCSRSRAPVAAAVPLAALGVPVHAGAAALPATTRPSSTPSGRSSPRCPSRRSRRSTRARRRPGVPCHRGRADPRRPAHLGARARRRVPRPPGERLADRAHRDAPQPTTPVVADHDRRERHAADRARLCRLAADRGDDRRASPSPATRSLRGHRADARPPPGACRASRRRAQSASREASARSGRPVHDRRRPERRQEVSSEGQREQPRTAIAVGGGSCLLVLLALWFLLVSPQRSEAASSERCRRRPGRARQKKTALATRRRP